jgi:glycine/D-amino acid oxidase-like deaminating enzyme
MEKVYKQLEHDLGIKFYHSKRILKPFSEDQEIALWLKKKEEDIGKYLNETIIKGELNNVVHNPIGMAEVLHAGNVDTNLLLSAYRAMLKNENLILEENFDFDQLTIKDDHILYKGVTASKVIFCEGHKAINNPYFKWLPFKLTKGETLTIRIPQEYSLSENTVINKAVFILPLGNNTYKVGATYEWDDLTEEITEKGRGELVENLKKVLMIPFEVIDQQAGIRPTVSDRRPLVGLHPEHPQLGVFNGLGTKGVMLAPYFAKQFVDHLENNGALDKEVDIARFTSKAKGKS